MFSRTFRQLLQLRRPFTIFGTRLLVTIWLLWCELCAPRSQPLLIEQWRVANAFVQLDTIVRSIYKLRVESMDSISSFSFLSFSFSGPGAPFSQTKADLDQLYDFSFKLTTPTRTVYHSSHPLCLLLSLLRFFRLYR